MDIGAFFALPHAVFFGCQDFKIAFAIVEGVAVFMMHHLTRWAVHDQAMHAYVPGHAVGDVPGYGVYFTGRPNGSPVVLF